MHGRTLRLAHHTAVHTVTALPLFAPAPGLLPRRNKGGGGQDSDGLTDGAYLPLGDSVPLPPPPPTPPASAERPPRSMGGKAGCSTLRPRRSLREGEGPLDKVKGWEQSNSLKRLAPCGWR